MRQGPAPLVPSALVEDINSASTDVEFMDYVGAGQVIKLAAARRAGAELSQVVRARDHHRRHRPGRRRTRARSRAARSPAPRSPATAARCSSSSAETSASARQRLPPAKRGDPAGALRRQAGDPASQGSAERCPRAGGRACRPARSSVDTITLGDERRRADRSSIWRSCRPRRWPAAASTASASAARKMTVKIDAKAKTGKTPVVSRLVRFPDQASTPSHRRAHGPLARRARPALMIAAIVAGVAASPALDPLRGLSIDILTALRWRAFGNASPGRLAHRRGGDRRGNLPHPAVRRHAERHLDPRDRPGADRGHRRRRQGGGLRRGVPDLDRAIGGAVRR